MIGVKALLALLLVAVSPLLLAASEATQPPPNPLSYQSVGQMLLGLLLVVGLILMLAWALRRFNAVPGQTGKMRVVASLPLGTRERAVLVQVGEEQLLLGVSAQSVSLLARFDQPVIEPGSSTSSEFSQRLAGYMNRGNR